MKKILILITCLFLCGCTTEYNINFKKDVIRETATAEYLKTELTEEELEMVEKPDYKFSILDNNKNKYKLKTSVDGKSRKTVYSFDYKYKDFINAKYLNDCFEVVNYTDKDDCIKVSLSGPFNCLYSDSMDINLTSDYYISSQNATGIGENGVYTWTIDKSNAENIEINFDIDKKIKGESQTENEEVSSTKKYGETIITIVLTVFLAFLILRYIKSGNKQIK